ncbi:Type I restriction-modification system, specificity subunit S (plasmid) [Lactococcus lactis subsp. lactis bv. diacetylactis]|uniref:restriction endonuclease subunit S n=1 Tax=Lactococcus lactis TaxID=1358 RepID=UPI0012466E3B|nr:restriction endonuclease subunit S [Lactococcus lactis]QEX47665.1 Type I restriction-modification system, specificity subunit S [Lactococcus lactis subsp. lactis bv. diacetylactis]
MMSKKSPQLRFEGFTDDWEERKFGQLYKKNNEKNKGQFTSNKTISIASMKFKPEGNGASVDSLDGYKVLRIGDIAYEGHKNKQFSFGRFLLNDIGDGIMSPRFTTLRPITPMDINFWKQYIIYEPIMKHLLVKSTKLGTMMNELVQEDLFKLSLVTPSDKEQQQIGTFFKQLDDTIALHQRKLDLLKEQKKGYLQKMFPKNGAKVPELRFAGFADDWEERKLSDLFIKGGSGGTPKSTNKAFYDGDIPFLGISDITKSNGFINNTEKHISSDGLNSSAAWIVSKGAISLAMYASVGKLAILNIDAATSQAFYNMIFDDYDLRDLVYQRLNKANELSEWNKLISTGTQSNLNADKVKNFQMYLPKNHDEIKLISTFFKQIDNTITLHQRKLDLLKEQKKGFLQKMFV